MKGGDAELSCTPGEAHPVHSAAAVLCCLTPSVHIKQCCNDVPIIEGYSGQLVQGQL